MARESTKAALARRGEAIPRGSAIPDVENSLPVRERNATFSIRRPYQQLPRPTMVPLSSARYHFTCQHPYGLITDQPAMFMLADAAVQGVTLSKVIGGAALLTIPWVSSWKKIDWHFTRENKSLSPIFNGTASVLSTLLFTGAVYKTPPEWWVRLPIWAGFIAATILVVTYVGILFAYKKTVAEGGALRPLLAGLTCYIALWGVAAVYTRQVFIFSDYRVNGGVVYLNGKPAPFMRLELLSPEGERTGVIMTNHDGTWLDFRQRRKEDGSGSQSPTRLRLSIDNTKAIEQPLVQEGRIDPVYQFHANP